MLRAVTAELAPGTVLSGDSVSPGLVVVPESSAGGVGVVSTPVVVIDVCVVASGLPPR